MTIFFTWQLIVTLDSIRNSCDVYWPIILARALVRQCWITLCQQTWAPFSMIFSFKSRFMTGLWQNWVYMERPEAISVELWLGHKAPFGMFFSKSRIIGDRLTFYPWAVFWFASVQQWSSPEVVQQVVFSKCIIINSYLMLEPLSSSDHHITELRVLDVFWHVYFESVPGDLGSVQGL